MKINRKKFINVLGTTMGGYMFLPKFLYALNETKTAISDNHKLVIVQLTGGNDGLNTIIPYNDPLYYHYRPNLGLKENSILKINDQIAWHSSCASLADLMDAGNLSIVQNVGYENPNRSHFRSMEIWQTASDREEYLSEGWLGRYLNLQCNGIGATCGIDMSSYNSLALTAEKSNSLAVRNPDLFDRLIKSIQDKQYEDYNNPNLEYVNQLALSALDGHEEIKKAINKTTNNVNYPTTDLAKRLQYIARFIKGGMTTKVYYTTKSGFDTHSNQLTTQSNSLKEVSDAISYFYKDLKNDNLHQDITILVFSEFGRRVKENGSGTDHGGAAPVFIIGGNNKNKIIGNNPKLDQLDNNGDLVYEIDFRSVYATLLADKLNFNPNLIGIKQNKIKGLF